MDPSIIGEDDVIYHLLNAKGKFVPYLGAGVSIDAGVMTGAEISEEIRRRIQQTKGLTDLQVKRELEWKKIATRYLTCVRKGLQTEAERVEFFREMTNGKGPCYSHFAIAQMMARNYLGPVSLTTNFDKLLEKAFVIDGDMECQALRSVEECKFWKETGSQAYILKIHGDYDTQNIKNTVDETYRLPVDLENLIATRLKDRGLLVLGTAGFEKSIHTLFDFLADKAARNEILQWGLFWGVHIGSVNVSTAEAKELVRARLKAERVSVEIVQMMSRMSGKDLFHFFPVRGVSNFLMNLISRTGDKNLEGTTMAHLDHEMRLRMRLATSGVTAKGIQSHLENLAKKKKEAPKKKTLPGTAEKPTEICRLDDRHKNKVIRVFFGDVSSRSFMQSPEFAGQRRAIVSPEDTCLTSGGGAAYTLMQKAGEQFLLPELQKFAPVSLGDVAVTSGGRLPVHHIFHAAGLEIQKSGKYNVSTKTIEAAVARSIQIAEMLSVQCLWLPLLGSGAANLEATKSLRAVLRAALKTKWPGPSPLSVLVFIRSPATVGREVVLKIARSLRGGAKYTENRQSPNDLV